MTIDNSLLQILLVAAGALIYIIRQEGKTKLIEQRLTEALKESGYLVLEGVKFKNKQHEFDMALVRIEEKLTTTIDILHELKDKLKNYNECRG